MAKRNRRMHEYDQQDRKGEAIREIQRIGKKLNRTPTGVQYRQENTTVTYDQIIGIFGRWNEAIKAAGLLPNPLRVPPNQRISDQYIISELIRVSNLLGRFPSHPEFTPCADISRGPVERRFGSWVNARNYIANNYADQLNFKLEPTNEEPEEEIVVKESAHLQKIGCHFTKEPTNEMETIVLFSLLAKTMGYKILRAQVPYPDMIVEKDGQELKMEVEFVSSNYINHGHPRDEGTICLCWRKNEDIEGVAIIDLETFVRKMAENDQKMIH